ncbi:MAG: hypothetical protein HZA22_02355 [Nitrospirae bacterium]|nr:hypothetical protein [Nitrospirota bacterium]MBI5696330.1 hypothetical protein [Nitrospirota bacterium]
MPFAGKVLILVAAAFAMNVPLGYLREGAKKFSFRWFLYIHMSIPFIVLLRTGMGISYWYIPLSLGSAVAGQLVGGRMRSASGRAG